MLKIWDIEAQAEALNLEDHPEVPLSVDWSADGSQIATTCKDKKFVFLILVITKVV